MPTHHYLISPQKLAVFAKVAELCNITHAAQALNMTQPAVTNIIKQLESHYEQKLIQMHGKTLVITQVGDQLIKHWRQIQAAYINMDEELSELKSGERGSIRIAMVSTAKYLVPSVINDFLSHFSNADFSCHVCHREEVLAGTLNYQYDIGLLTNPPYDPNLNALKLCHNTLAFIVNPKHPLAKKKPLQFNDIKQQPFIIREKSALISQCLYHYFHQHDASPIIQYHIDSTEGLKEAVISSSKTVALVPLISVKRAIEQKLLKTLALNTGIFKNDWYVITHKQHTLNQISLRFHQLLCDTLIPPKR